MTKPIVRRWWRFRYYPCAICSVWGWRDKFHSALDLGNFAYVPKKGKS